MNTIIFPLPGNEALAAALVQMTGAVAGDGRFRSFPDGETYLRFTTPVRGHMAVVACTLNQPDEKLLRLYLAARTLRDLGATRVLLVAPYLPYLRQDTVFAPGEGISAKHVGEWISGFIDGLVTVEPHLHRIDSLSGIYRRPLRVVSAASSIARWIEAEVREPVLIGPDEESRQWVAAIAQRLRCPYRVLTKRRYGDRAVSVDIRELDLPTWVRPVLVDDIIASGRTQAAAIGLLKSRGLNPPVCIAVHGLFAGDASNVLDQAGSARTVSCNTVTHASNAIDLHHDIALALSELIASLR